VGGRHTNVSVWRGILICVRTIKDGAGSYCWLSWHWYDGGMDDRERRLRTVSRGEPWPSGQAMPIASLDVDDDWVIRKFGSNLTSGFEPGLGPWVGTGARLPSGACVQVLRYELGGPMYCLFGDFDAPLDDVLEEFVSVTDLPRSAIRWRHSEA
jgi:hypothetical protein